MARLRGASRVFRDTIPVVQPVRLHVLYKMVRAHTLFRSDVFVDLGLRQYFVLGSRGCGRGACLQTHTSIMCPRKVRNALLEIWAALYRSSHTMWSVRQYVERVRRGLYMVDLNDLTYEDWRRVEEVIYDAACRHSQQAIKVGLEIL